MEFETKHDQRSCDVCQKTKGYYIDNFRIDLCLPKKKIILGTDLFTCYICLNCLTEKIKKVFVEDLRIDKKTKWLKEVDEYYEDKQNGTYKR